MGIPIGMGMGIKIQSPQQPEETTEVQ